MPFKIDEEKMSGLKMMDIANPPIVQFGYEAFPKCVYLHPKDKTKEHKSKIVHDKAELDAATKQGWKTKPHIPEAPPAPDADDYETSTK
jgi:hypothetical protein